MKNTMWYLLWIVVAIWVVLISNTCKAETKIGFDLQAGTDVICPGNYASDKWVNTVERMSLRYELNTLLPYENLWIGIEGVYSRHKAHSKTVPGFDTGFVDYGVNFTAKYQFFDDLFYVGILGGFSYWFNRDHGGHFGSSHYLGTFGAMTGKDWKVFDTPWSIRTEIRFTHTSDPFGPDPDDMELISAVVGVTYTF